MDPASTAASAHKDIVSGLRQFSLAWFLAREDIRQRYVRTMLGPLWMVLSTGVTFVVLAVVMSSLFSNDMADYLRFMASGLLLWMWIASCLSESPNILVLSGALIQSFPLPITTQYLRFMLRNTMILLHNAIILLIVYLCYPSQHPLYPWMALAGFALNTLVLLGVSVCFSLANVRYRDMRMIILNMVQILPLVTPVFWSRATLKSHLWIADLNPLYHMLEIMRAPLLGQEPALASWLVSATAAILALGMAYIGFRRFRHRIIFWI